MNIKINIPRFMQHETNGVTEFFVNGNTIEECLSDLVRHFPRLREDVIDKNGKINDSLAIWINKEKQYYETDTNPITDGDELDILISYFGG